MREQSADLVHSLDPVDSFDAEVVVVGGGPAGLTMAMLLAQQGVDVQLFERRAATTRLPRAHLINQRTMEIFDSLGVAEAVRALSPPENKWHRVGWYTSLAGDRPGTGQVIGHVQAWGGDCDAERYAAASPQTYANLPQMRLDPLLREHAARACPGRIHFGHEVVDLLELGAGVNVTVRAVETGSTRTVRARYVVAADGGRFCAARLGVKMDGPSQVYDMVTVHFTADLSTWIEDEQTLLYYFINPQGQGSFDGCLCAMGPSQWGRSSEEWSYHQAFAWGDPEARDETRLVQRMRDTLGIPDLDLELHAVTHWEFEGVVANQFRVGRSFLTGNAAHRHPPSGGLGLNTAVQDVYNLAWKLALVLRGAASDELLTTYAVERHAVGSYNVQHALENVGGHRRIAAALGLHQGQEIEDGWHEVDVWLSDTPAGAARRLEVAAAVSSNSDDYGQLNVELGYAYRSAAIVDDDAVVDGVLFEIQTHVPSSAPGHHLPHAWLHGPKGRVSTYNAFPPTGFALFLTGAGQEPWAEAVAQVQNQLCVEVSVVAVGDDAPYTDADGAWELLRGTGSTGALLVRPDRHVAWRVDEAPDDPVEALLAAAQAICLTTRA